ncbi:ABC transporter permease [Pseudonocardia phyllosphaerae]|uniref:ABC transporter permease n=1 Tax=Pseudonocardia phyllosphaerae TaxID=3390502 RepID=UPI00397DDEC7
MSKLLDLGSPVTAAVDWLTVNLAGFFEVIASVMLALVNALLFVLTAPHPLVLVAAFAGIAWWASRRWGLPTYTALAFLVILALDLWTPAMQSLAVVLVASAIAVAIGVPLGVWAARSRRVSVAVRPVLDLMQTLPVFVYLIPTVFFFGIGVMPGIVATMLFALPPAVRLTELGIRQVDAEVVEAAEAFGTKPWQVLREVQLPLALPSIMAGVNQVIMLSLSMVVIAGMVGADGLGSVVVQGISQLDVGAGFEGGVAVVLVAIFLDRTTNALARPKRSRRRRKRPVAPEPAVPASESRPTAAAGTP